MPVYVDNASNRKLGRVGKEKGTKSAPKKNLSKLLAVKPYIVMEDHTGDIITKANWIKENKGGEHFEHYLKLLWGDSQTYPGSYSYPDVSPAEMALPKKKKSAPKKKKYNDTFENHEGKIISRKDWMKENKNSKHYKYYLKLLFERE